MDEGARGWGILPAWRESIACIPLNADNQNVDMLGTDLY
jgi:hypothetical protein